MSDFMPWDRPFAVHPDPDLLDLIPTYLQRRHADAERIADAIAGGDSETVRFVGHSMKGSGGGYGFDGLTEIGGALEEAGSDSDLVAAARALDYLLAYLDNVEVRDD
jgi:HPt (histidine-containing phosphotransfer) domain-containing protein